MPLFPYTTLFRSPLIGQRPAADGFRAVPDHQKSDVRCAEFFDFQIVAAFGREEFVHQRVAGLKQTGCFRAAGIAFLNREAHVLRADVMAA